MSEKITERGLWIQLVLFDNTKLKISVIIYISV